jgi:DNA-binding CsgD family transcriptional regulator
MSSATSFCPWAVSGSSRWWPSELPAAGALRRRRRLRESEVVHLVVEGFLDKQIAGRLEIGVGTVRTYLDRVKAKTGLRERAELIRAYEGSSTQTTVDHVEPVSVSALGDHSAEVRR